MFTAIVFFGGMVLGGMIDLLVLFVWELYAKKPLRITHRYSLGKN